MADEAFSLKDAIALYSGKIDLSHKLWTYLQVVAAGAAGFAWGATRPPTAVLVVVLVAFLVFAGVNGLLLVSTQREAVEIAKAIKNYDEEHPNEIQSFSRVLATLKPWRASWVAYAHIGIDVVTVGAIVAQLGIHCGWWSKLHAMMTC
jgi:hypothetical protein